MILWSGLNVAGMEGSRADKKSCKIKSDEDTKRFDDPRPGDGLGKDKAPGAKVVSQKPLPIRLKGRNAFHNKIEEKERESQDCCRSRFHVEARKHESDA